jgi:hypothetical protein
MHPARGNFLSGCGRASVRTSISYFLARDSAASKLIAVKIWESKGMRLRVAPGSFGSRMSDCVDGGLPVLGEVLEAVDGFETKTSNNGQRGVS